MNRQYPFGWGCNPHGGVALGLVAPRTLVDLSFFTLWAPGGSESLGSRFSSAEGSSRASSDNATSEVSGAWLRVVTRLLYPWRPTGKRGNGKAGRDLLEADPSQERVVSSLNVGPDGAELLDL